MARYFAKQQAEIERLEADAAAIGQMLEELLEEHCGEDGLLEDAKDEDEDKLTKASAAARLKKIKSDLEAAEERRVLAEYVALCERETELGAQAKSVQEALMEKVFAQYGKLPDDNIRTLLVEDKWLDRCPPPPRGGEAFGDFHLPFAFRCPVDFCRFQGKRIRHYLYCRILPEFSETRLSAHLSEDPRTFRLLCVPFPQKTLAKRVRGADSPPPLTSGRSSAW